MMRMIAVVFTTLCSVTVLAQQYRIESKTKDYAKLFRLSSPSLKAIGGRNYLDVQKPFVIAEDAVVLDPDDKTESTEPGRVINVEMGKRDGKSVWLRLKILKEGDEEKILRNEDFAALTALLGGHGVSTQSCAGDKTCTKWCTSGSTQWCCEWRCK